MYCHKIHDEISKLPDALQIATQALDRVYHIDITQGAKILQTYSLALKIKKRWHTYATRSLSPVCGYKMINIT